LTYLLEELALHRKFICYAKVLTFLIFKFVLQGGNFSACCSTSLPYKVWYFSSFLQKEDKWK